MELTSSGCTLLSWLVFLPLGGSVLMMLLPKVRDRRSANVARAFASIIAFVNFVFSLYVLLPVLSSVDAAGVISNNPWETSYLLQQVVSWIPSLGVRYIVAVDGLSVWFLVLTTLLTFLVIVSSKNISVKPRAYFACLLSLETGMLGAFVALDLVTFYVFWELMLIPMYFIIGIWGGDRRVYAAIKFVLYTALGSLLMLVGIAYLGYVYYSQFGHLSFYYGDWQNLDLSVMEEFILFSAFAFAFAIKVPVFPLHTWLPDAHVEAPTGGSVILAGILLKLGLYGLIRFCLPLFPHAAVATAPLFCTLGIIGIVYGALMAWVQTDIKKLVAYSSVSHLGFCVLGFSAMNFEGMQGCVLQMFNHGVSTGALFLLVGALYDRKHTRKISDYGGLAAKVPVFSAVFMIFTLSSIGLPVTNGFVGEFLVLLGSFGSRSVSENHAILGTAVAVSGVVLGAMYMLSLYRRVFFGEIDSSRNGDLTDLDGLEKAVLAPLVIMVFVIGICPGVILSVTESSSRVSLNYLSSSYLLRNVDGVGVDGMGVDGVGSPTTQSGVRRIVLPQPS